MSAPTSAFDLAILGAGPGGYVAAIRASQLGLRVAVVERAELGGICANWGCIPTKALLKTGETMRLLAEAEELGIKVEVPKADFAATIARSRKIADRQAKGVEYLFKKNKVTTLRGSGELRKTPAGVRLFCDGKEVDAPKILVATGARPRPLPHIKHDGKLIWSYFEAMNQKEQPARLAIIGAGAIGVEFAYFYAALGTQVTLVEAMPAILPIEDREISTALEKELGKQGIKILTAAKVGGVETIAVGAGQGVRLSITDKDGKPVSVEADRCLLATGVQGNVEGFGLEAIGCKTERGFVVVDKATYRTSVENVYAIGDVIGGALLAHKASAEGIACVEGIAGKQPHAVNYAAIPGCTYCLPEVASVGLTEEKCKEQKLAYDVGRFPFKASGKAMAASHTTGFVKVILGKPHGELLGAHILGGASTDMIATLTLAISNELTIDELLSTVFAHPTYAEAIKEAVADAHGEAIDL